MKFWVLSALGVLVLAGCGAPSAEKSAPQSPGGYRGSGGAAGQSDLARNMPSPAPPARDVAMHSELQSAPGSTSSSSPSMAGGFEEAGERPFKTSTEKAAPDRDADGIADAADRAPAPVAPAPPPPPPGQPPKGGKDGDLHGDSARGGQPHDAMMLVYTANINLAVYLVDQAINQVEAIAKDNGGFLSSRGDNQIVIRVPRARFQAALAAVEKTGDVLHRDVRAQDVTDEYMDLEIRIKNARAVRDQLAALMTKASVKEAIEIERELGRVTEELERMEGQLKLLKDKIAYSTITVTYAARGSSISAASVRLPFPWLSQLGLPSLLRLEETK